jgi:hypothetical protein
MSTRGFVGFVADGQEKITYNHYDSYPRGIGAYVLRWLSSADRGTARALARSLRVVSQACPPTDEDIARLTLYCNPDVDGGSDRPTRRPTWYQLLHKTQGDPALILAAGVLEDASDFPYDSLWAEWGYLIDFDAGMFEVYRGFQGQPHTAGRFARPQPRDGYYPVALAACWPLEALPTEAAFLAALR